MHSVLTLVRLSCAILVTGWTMISGVAAQELPEMPTSTPVVGSEGWYGERLPAGLRKARQRPYYVWGLKVLEIDMVYVPPAEFHSGGEDPRRPPSQRGPQVRDIKYGYFIGRFETTWRDYLSFCSAASRKPPPPPEWGVHADHPVVNVTWADAREFCAWAGLDLPGEFEWEKAARGIDRRNFPWGDAWVGTECNHGTDDGKADVSDGARFTARVGSYPGGVSIYGAFDMAGNVWEWTKDEFAFHSPIVVIPGDQRPYDYRVTKGGSWMAPSYFCQVWYSAKTKPGFANSRLGFRPVLRLSGDKSEH